MITQMKRFFALSALLICAFAFTGCGGDSRGADYSPFLPFTENLVLVYEIEGTDGFHDIFLKFNAFVQDNRMQRLLQMSGGIAMVEVIEMIDGRAVNVIGRTNREERWLSPHDSIIDDGREMFWVILPNEINEGAAWHVEPLFDDDNSVKTITGVDVRITTPAGTFNTIEVSQTGMSDGDFHVEPVTRRFYAEGVGLVKQRAYGGIPATVELWEIDDFEQLVRTTILMEIIHGGLQADTSTFHVDAYGGIPRVPIHLTTNNHLLDVLNSILQGTTQAVLGHELPNDARLLSYFVNPATENLHLDFSAGFLREMGLMTNSQNEESFLASLISIFGFFLNVQAGTITVEGQPYLGEHVSIRSMEFWSVEDSFGFLPEIPPYTDEEIAMALSITESMRQPLYDIIGQIIPEFRAVDEDEWHMDEQGRGFVPAAMPFESIDQIRAAVEGVFTEHFITGHFEWSLFDEYWGYFTEVDGQLYHAAADFPVAEIFWWSWEAGEEVNPWHIHDDIFAASIGERNVLFVLEDDGRWLIDDIWLYWQW